MATKKNNQAKFTAWTESTRIEASGSIAHCAVNLFACIYDAQEREKALADIQARHEKLKEWEAKNETDVGN